MRNACEQGKARRKINPKYTAKPSTEEYEQLRLLLPQCYLSPQLLFLRSFSSSSALPPSTYLTRPQHAPTPILGAADNSYQLNTRSSKYIKPLSPSNPLRVE